MHGYSLNQIKISKVLRYVLLTIFRVVFEKQNTSQSTRLNRTPTVLHSARVLNFSYKLEPDITSRGVLGTRTHTLRPPVRRSRVLSYVTNDINRDCVLSRAKSDECRTRVNTPVRPAKTTAYCLFRFRANATA